MLFSPPELNLVNMLYKTLLLYVSYSYFLFVGAASGHSEPIAPI